MKSTPERFAFGKNWTSFLSNVSESHISAAAEKLQSLVGDLRGKAFLDIGSGSGIHSLAAVRLGASRVHSFDYDRDSVNCSAELKRRFAPSATWKVEQGSALDEDYLKSLGKFDVVYSWGVLHHTGNMWKALELATIPLAPNGVLAVAIYNDQGFQSKIWRGLKRAYVSAPILRPALIAFTFATSWGAKILIRPHRVIKEWRTYRKLRGMSPWHDVIDWAGGYPFEVAKPSDLQSFYERIGFHLCNSRLVGNKLGCNELVFTGKPLR